MDEETRAKLREMAHAAGPDSPQWWRRLSARLAVALLRRALPGMRSFDPRRTAVLLLPEHQEEAPSESEGRRGPEKVRTATTAQARLLTLLQYEDRSARTE